MTAAWRRGVLRDTGAAAGPLVVKLGGSLLTRVGWAAEVTALLESLVAPLVIVTGGGPIVDGLRVIDRVEALPADLVHRLAVDCMGQTARVVAAALCRPLVSGPEARHVPTAVLDTPAWLAATGRCDALPVGWHVTSDSIAALVAAAHGGGLMLVKSVPPPDDGVERLAETGWVDAWFPTAARPLAHIAWAAPG